MDITDNNYLTRYTDYTYFYVTGIQGSTKAGGDGTQGAQISHPEFARYVIITGRDGWTGTITLGW